ncbi:MAG: thioredoxin family protein [Runella sp.]
MQRFFIAVLAAFVMIGSLAAMSCAPNQEKTTVSETSSPSVEITTASEGIQFVDASWAKVLEKAQKEKKLIFFDAYTSWCGPCKMLQRNVFTRKDVAEFFNANFVNVKKDMEIGEGPMLAEKYPIEGYPSLFFLDAKGKIVTQHLGYIEAEALINLGKRVAKK